MERFCIKVFTLLFGAMLVFALYACDGGGSDGDDGGDSSTGTYLDISVCDPAGGPFTLEITNPYLPYAVGSQWVFEGIEDGAAIRLQIDVLDETEDVAGVTTRVVQESEWEDDELIEISRNFFVQASDGTVCYFGEDVDIYEDGTIVSSEGAWRAGEDGNLPGIMMPGAPEVGNLYQQEVAAGVAEDEALITAIGEPYTVAAGTFADTLATEESSPLEPGSEDEKRYASGVGLIVDAEAELTSYTLP